MGERIVIPIAEYIGVFEWVFWLLPIAGLICFIILCLLLKAACRGKYSGF